MRAADAFQFIWDVFPKWELSLSLWIIHNFEVIKSSCSSRKNRLVNWESLNIYFLVFIILGSPVRAEWWVKAATIILFPVLMCTQSYLTLCDPMDCSPPGSTVHRILQAILEWVAIFSSRESSQPRDRTCISCTAGRFFTCWAVGKALSPPSSPHLTRWLHSSSHWEVETIYPLLSSGLGSWFINHKNVDEVASACSEAQLKRPCKLRLSTWKPV